jgi:hypothetical protein
MQMDSAIYHAVRRDNIQCLQLLISAGCPMEENAVECAAGLKNIQCLQMLIAAGCPMDHGAIYHAAETGRADNLRLLIQSGCPTPPPNCSKTAAWVAAREGRTDCLKVLIQAGFEIRGDEVLEASFWGNADCVEVLVDAGCPFEVTACDLNTWSEDQLDSAFARKHIWPLDLKSREIGCHCRKQCCQKKIDIINNLKAKKTETDRVAIESCKILPVDVVKHVLCSYF